MNTFERLFKKTFRIHPSEFDDEEEFHLLWDDFDLDSRTGLEIQEVISLAKPLVDKSDSARFADEAYELVRLTYQLAANYRYEELTHKFSRGED